MCRSLSYGSCVKTPASAAGGATRGALSAMSAGSRRRRDAGLDAETGGDKVEQMLALTLGEARVLEAPAVKLQPALP